MPDVHSDEYNRNDCQNDGNDYNSAATFVSFRRIAWATHSPILFKFTAIPDNTADGRSFDLRNVKRVDYPPNLWIREGSSFGAALDLTADIPLFGRNGELLESNRHTRQGGGEDGLSVPERRT